MIDPKTYIPNTLASRWITSVSITIYFYLKYVFQSTAFFHITWVIIICDLIGKYYEAPWLGHWFILKNFLWKVNGLSTNIAKCRFNFKRIAILEIWYLWSMFKGDGMEVLGFRKSWFAHELAVSCRFNATANSWKKPATLLKNEFFKLSFFQYFDNSRSSL